jgi:hypothetical protein
LLFVATSCTDVKYRFLIRIIILPQFHNSWVNLLDYSANLEKSYLIHYGCYNCLCTQRISVIIYLENTHICGNYKHYYPLSAVCPALCIFLSKMSNYILIIRAGNYSQFQYSKSNRKKSTSIGLERWWRHKQAAPWLFASDWR